jgi:hypothetical protein
VGYQALYDDQPAHRDQPLVPAPWVETNSGDGCLASTVGDMAAYVRVLLKRGQGARGRLISAASFERMTGQHSAIGHDRYYGYGVVTAGMDGHWYLLHGGDLPGYNSTWRADVEAGVGAVALMNGPLAPGIPAYAVNLVRAALHGGELPASPACDPLTVEDAAAYAGTYRAGDRTLNLMVEDEHLILRHDGAAIALEQRDDDSFYIPHPDFARFLVTFGRDTEGRIVEAFHGADWYVNARYAGPTAVACPLAWTAYVGHYRAHNPWRSNFRVVARRGVLLLVEPSGEQALLSELEPGVFRVGAAAYSPEWLRFDTIVDGQALRARLSTCDYYRFFTP